LMLRVGMNVGGADPCLAFSSEFNSLG
jgi:hypothetical protein